MTPLEELQADGRLGPEGARLLYRVVRTVVVGHGFPPPGDRPAWTGEAVAETAHEFLADERTPKRLAHLLVHAVDDDSFTRLLHRMVLNFLRDGGRRTEIGRLMLRLRDVLIRNNEFVAGEGDRWRLEKQPAAPSTVAPAALVEAAAAERHVEVPRWSAQARRRAPAADAASLERLCRRVLEAAAGTLPLDQLAQAVAPRLGLVPTPLVSAAADRDTVESVAGPQHADAVLDNLRAAEIFAILNRRERLLLAAAGTPVRELRAVIGVGPSQAAQLQARLRAILAAELQDDEGYEAVFFHLVDQAKAWARQQGEYQQEEYQQEEHRHATGQPDAIERLMDSR
ncbi:MAG TPA: hypothetical protein VEG38_05395 [Acidimicrobiia bacterium]|nr:hypothetical protein [Acidimicrobiia bacterium]